MPIYQGFADRFRGTVAVDLREQVEKDIDRKICSLLEVSILLWKQDNWQRYNQGEDNCTAQLYRCCRDATRQDDRFELLVAHYQWIDLTPSMLDGSESVQSAKRPDIRIEIGEIGRTLECKRLAPEWDWYHGYVYDGLARFVLGTYGRGEPVGYMIGYVQAGNFTQLVAGINKQILRHSEMGNSDQLKLLQEDEVWSWSRSCHTRLADESIQVDHLMVDLPPLSEPN